MDTRSRYHSFTAKENIGNRAAGRKYDVRESCICDWHKKQNATYRNDHKARHLELEERLCDYVDDKRQYGYVVTSEICYFKALVIIKELGITDFKATLRL